MNSLRAQLTLRLLVGGGLLLGGAGTVLHWQVRQALTAQFDATLRATAQSLAGLTEQKNGEISVENTSETMPQFDRANGPDVFAIRTADGREVKRSISLGTRILPRRVGLAHETSIFEHTLSDGRVMRCVSLGFTPEDESGAEKQKGRVLAEAALVAGTDRAPLDQTLNALRAGLLAVGAGALAVFGMLIRWEVRRGLAPLDDLGETVSAVEAGSLDTRFPVEPLPSELQPIAARLNGLLARLEAAFSRERRFTATAAHELRTPLAELRALAEVNLITPTTEAEHLESWKDALATTQRMETLSLRLLELARAEDPGRVVRREPLSIAEVFASAWRPCAARAAQRELTLVAALPEDLVVQSDAALLGVILGNLCSNAVEYAPAGTVVHVDARRTPNATTLYLRNCAPELTTADLPHLFERFWRKDAARTDAQHHGLGLGLAAQFASLLGGTLTAQLSTAQELEVALSLPATQPASRDARPALTVSRCQL